jgi:hypothetical protein
MFAYGAVNLVQDGWNEQLVKLGTVDARIPSALLPGFTAVWGVVLALAVLATLALLREQRRTAYSAA